MKFIKPFNENSNNLFPNVERILDIVKFNDQTLSYWLGYSNNENTSYENIDQARRGAKRIIEEFEDSEDGGAPAKNKDLLLNEMVALAKILISFRGSVNAGILEAYCAQNMDVVEWAKSDTLKDLNKKTGIFESLNYFENNEECGLAKLKEQISVDHLLFIEKINEFLKPNGFEMKFVELINGKLGGHYIVVRVNNIGFIIEGFDHMRPHKNSMDVWQVFKDNNVTYFYDMQSFVDFYKQHNLHLYDMSISKTGIFK